MPFDASNSSANILGRSDQWPPSSLRGAGVAQQIQCMCEDAEVAGGRTGDNNDALVLVIHMSSLLFQQKFESARHLFRRNCTNNSIDANSVLQPYSRVWQTALVGDISSTMIALQQLLASSTANGDTIASTYVTEILEEYRWSHLKGWVTKNCTPPEYCIEALGFSSRKEYDHYVQERCCSAGSPTTSIMTTNAARNLADSVVFLEIRRTT